MFITNNHASIHLSLEKKKMLNYQKVSKYYEHDCLQNFLLLFTTLLTALIVKNRLYFGWNLLHVSKKAS